jgi:glycerophosphoryl diester phosphodiesterase
MIELDVYACKTGELVIIHDDEVDRTTNGHGNVVDMTFDELRSLIVEGVEQIPTLEEVIELLDRKVILNVELKGPHTAKPVAELLNKYLQNGWNASDFVVSSFDHEQIKTFQQLSPEILTGALFSSRHNPEVIIDEALAVRAHFIGIDTILANETLVSNALTHNLPVYVFTINTRARADELRCLGISGIFSNYPDLMM